MFKEELIQLIQDPEVVEALWKAMFGGPSKIESAVVPLANRQKTDGTTDLLKSMTAPAIGWKQVRPPNDPNVRVAWNRVHSWVNFLTVDRQGRVWGSSSYAVDPDTQKPASGSYCLMCSNYKHFSSVLVLGENCVLPVVIDRMARRHGSLVIHELSNEEMDEFISGLPKGNLLQPDTEAAIKEVLSKPAQPAQDVIPWDVLDPRWKFAICSPEGESFVCQEKPVKVDSGWRLSGGAAVQISGLIGGFVAGYCPWYDSLQERPRE